MTATERKLDEAQYFLEQLEKHYPYFDYILSAFISAARSVSWVMRYEYSKVEGWEKWFSESKISEKEKELLFKTNNWRIAVAKKDGIKTEFRFVENLVTDEEYYPIIDKLLKETSEGEIVKLTLRLPGEIESNEEKDEDFSEGISFRVRKITTKDNFELSRESIKKVCQEYYLVLKNQVETCSGKFNY
jgi:hypothetical protein